MSLYSKVYSDALSEPSQPSGMEDNAMNDIDTPPALLNSNAQAAGTMQHVPSPLTDPSTATYHGESGTGMEDDVVSMEEEKTKKWKKPRLAYTSREVAVINEIVNEYERENRRKDWEEINARLYEECSKIIPNYVKRDHIALRAKCYAMRKLGSGNTGRKGGDSGSASQASSTTSSKKRITYDLVPVYENASDILRSAPPRRTRPRKHGDIVGEALIYGDDLSWGMSPDSFSRTWSCHWPSLVKERFLSKGLRIVQSCMPGRTTIHNDPQLGDWDFPLAEEETFNGLHHFGPVFASHSPRWLVLMLGTHDLKKRIRAVAKATCEGTDSPMPSPTLLPGKYAMRIAENCASLALKARKMFEGHCHEGRLNIVLVVPPRIRLTKISESFGFDETSVAISERLPEAFIRISNKYHFRYAYRKLSMKHSVDGIHLTAKATSKLADTIWETMLPDLPRETKKPERFAVVH